MAKGMNLAFLSQVTPQQKCNDDMFLASLFAGYGYVHRLCTVLVVEVFFCYD
jgi:hypothetical protein